MPFVDFIVGLVLAILLKSVRVAMSMRKLHGVLGFELLLFVKEGTYK